MDEEAMTERGILFTPENYGKVELGYKTQTRRIMKPQPPEGATIWQTEGIGSTWQVRRCDPWHSIKCPYGTVGDQVYVKEGLVSGPNRNVCWRRDGLSLYPIRDWRWDRNWLSPLHMPKWAARLWLELTDVRVERLNSISREDAKAEGLWPGANGLEQAAGRSHGNAQLAFQALWDSIHGKGSWDANPWVWIIEFKKVNR